VLHVREIYAGAGGRAERALWPLLRRRLLRADALACVSASVAAQFGDVLGVHLVPDAARNAPGPIPRAEARAALGTPPDRFVVAVVGRISDWKGQRVLTRALAEPPLADRGAVALVAGAAAPGQHRFEHELAELGRRLGLGERLRLLGFREDVETVLAASDAAVVPSTRADALPGAALEALAAGVPLVASDLGGLRDIVDDGVSGRLVPPSDPVALAAALGELASNPVATDRLSKVARDARARFSLRRTVEAMQSCYDAVLE